MENEIELIKGCRAGKDSARKELYTLYSRQMLAVCFRYTGDMEAAHDVLHDGFIKIFTNFSFRGEASLGTWVTRVMVTQALDYLRRQKRVSQLEVHEEQRGGRANFRRTVDEVRRRSARWVPDGFQPLCV